MRLSVGQLRSLLREELMLEYDVQPGVRLYHRSYVKFKIGDVLTAQKDPKTGQHWLMSHEHEQALERVRKQLHPDLPSRLDCVYASFVPHSRFLNKGHLYVIEPVGKVFVTDSRIIDEMAQSRHYRHASVLSYWEGVEPERWNIANLEALMTSAKVVEVVEEKTRLKFNDVIEFNADAPVVSATISYYSVDPKYDTDQRDMRPYTYAEDGNTNVSIEDALEKVKHVKGMKVLDKPILNPSEEMKYGKKLNVELSHGFVGKIRSLSMASPGDTTRYSRISLSPVDGGLLMTIDDKVVGQILRAIRAGTISRIGE